MKNYEIEYEQTYRGTGIVEAKSYQEALKLAIAKEIHFNDDEVIENYEITKIKEKELWG